MPKASTEFKKENKADFGKEKIDVLYEDEAQLNSLEVKIENARLDALNLDIYD